MIVCNQGKTLSGLSRLLHRSVDPKALADFFRESPWSIDQIGQLRKKFMLAKVLELAQAAGIELKIMVSLDDSLGKKDKVAKHLDAVDYHHNHAESTRKRQAEHELGFDELAKDEKRVWRQQPIRVPEEGKE